MKFLFVFLILLAGCSTSQDRGNERRNVDEFIELSETHSYFLADIPDWAHFVESADCKKSRLRYLNIEKLMSSFSFDYHKALQFQTAFNKEYNRIKKEVGINYLPIKNEEELFYNTLNRIQSGFYTIKLPKFRRLHLVWIDPYLNNPKKIESLLGGREMDQGPPVLVSMCLNHSELEEFQKKIKYSDINLSLISAEVLSSYSSKGEPKNSFAFEIDQFLKNRELYLYLPRGEKLPNEFRGKFRVKNY